MGFKVIGSDEELEAALTAGLLWINTSPLWPRSQDGWETCEWHDEGTRETWWDAKENSVARRKTGAGYLPEDFAVLVEEEDDSL